MNSNRMLGVTVGAQAKSSEKLSSGYKINRAADDAAGLSISEKMRRQIRGLTQASANAEDGISSVQTAEGALNEVHDMLQRMDELATKAANGTMSEDDRQNVQDEIDQLLTEVDRVSETTKFNETYLLKGNPDGTKSEMLVNAHDAGLAGKLTDNGDGSATFTADPLKNGDKVTIGGKEYTIGNVSSKTGQVKALKDLNTSTEGYDTAANISGMSVSAGDSLTADGETYTLTDNVDLNSITWTSGTTITVGEETYTVDSVSAGATATKIASADFKDFVAAELAKGNQITISNVSAGTKITAFDGSDATITAGDNIVDGLGQNEISIKALSAATVGGFKHAAANNKDDNVKAGDIATISGKTYEATDKTPMSAASAYTAIDALAAGSSVTVGTGETAKTYTIVNSEDDEDPSTYKLTKENILAQIKDGDKVKIGTNEYTVIGDIGESGTVDDVISLKDAYNLMSKELEQASSIGTDKGKEASVVNNNDGSFTITKGSAEVKDALAFNLHVGADADMTNKITVDIETMDSAGLGIKGLNVVDNSGNAATYAIDSIEDAIKKVSEQRSALGAVQNRLEHTIKNVDNVVENTTAAESQIRDTDMATEMVKYSNNNILMQAGQSMLAQANQSNQGVLSLLG